MKNLFLTSFLLLILSSCNDGQKNHETEESLPTNRLDAITSLDDSGDTTAVKDSTDKK